MSHSFRTPFYETPRTSDSSGDAEFPDLSICDLANAIQGIDALMSEFSERPLWSIAPQDRLGLRRISVDLMEIIKNSTARLNAFNVLLQNSNNDDVTRLVVPTGQQAASTEQIREMNINFAMECYHSWKDYDLSHRRFMRELASLHARALAIVHPEQVQSSSLKPFLTRSEIRKDLSRPVLAVLYTDAACLEGQ